MTVTINVRFYPPFRAVAGVRDCAVEVPRGAAVRDVLRHLVRQFPGLAPHLGALNDDQLFRRDALVILDDEVADLAWPVGVGSQVALVGPLQGG